MKFNEAKVKLEALDGASKFEKLMKEHELKPVVVGGFAVEIYSRSEYTTVDIDLVFRRRDLNWRRGQLLPSAGWQMSV